MNEEDFHVHDRWEMLTLRADALPVVEREEMYRWVVGVVCVMGRCAV